MRLIRLLKNDIAKEAQDWVKEDIITEVQAERICLRYDVDYQQVNSKSLGYSILIGLGYLFISLALIIIIGENWQDIPRLLRMACLITLTLATQAYALRQYIQGYNNNAMGIFFLGNMFYGASIILIAQIYHLGEHMPDGVFWWALGCLPIAVLSNSRLLILQTMLLAGIWFFMEVSENFYPTYYPIFLIAAVIALTRTKSSLILLLITVSSIGFWIEYSLAELWRENRYFKFHGEHFLVTIAMFISLYAFSYWLHQKDSVTAKDYGATLALWCLRAGLICLLIMSFEDPWQELIDHRWQHLPSLLLISIGFTTTATLFAYLTGKLISILVFSGLYWLSLITVIYIDNNNYAVYLQIWGNLLLVTAGIHLIIKGINEGISHYFFLGIMAILVLAFSRYIDLIGDYIGGAALFMVSASLLLGAAKYWKHHHVKEAAA